MATLLYGTGVYGDTYGAAALISALSTRERPPLRLSHDIETPSGKHYRWAEDESKAENTPSGAQFSDTMPGGFENGVAVLPRKSGIVYSDLEPLSTWTMHGPGGEIAWQGRLERAPRTSGEQMAVSPSAVGWQVYLEDDKSVRAIYVDRDLSRWTEAPLWRRKEIADGGFPQGKIPVSTADGGIVWDVPVEQIPLNEHSEIWYEAPAGTKIQKFRHRGSIFGSFAGFEAPTLYTTDSNTSLAGASSFVLTLDNAIYQLDLVTPRRRAMLRVFASGGPVTPGGATQRRFDDVSIYGDTGIFVSDGPDGLGGVLASDVIAHAVGQWAPLLVINSNSIETSSFVIQQLTFLEATTVGEIVRQATRFGLEDWAVWERKEFVWHQRGARGRKWRARISPSQLEETGQDAARLFESVVVQYQDVDGSTRTVGPIGSGSDTEDAVLKDDDPENPVNKLGIIKRALLQMGVATVASATEVGRRFLEEQKLLDRSGRARLVGHVQDDRGVWHPYWKVRAGDYISFVDSSDTSYRRIVKTDKTHSERACSVDLDAPPEGLQALLERLGVVLVTLGL